MNILVTGGAGYIGSHTVVELVDAGYNPIIVDNHSNSEPETYKRLKKLLNKDLKHYKVDIRNTDELAKIIKQHSCQSVIHFAAFKAVGESVQDPLKYYANNVGGTVSVLNAMIKANVENIVFSSSTTVYGNPDELPTTENAPLQPATNPYGATKQICENIITDTTKAEKIKAVLLRYFNPIGAHPSGQIGELPIGVPAALMPYLTQTVAGIRKELTIFGDDYDTPDGTAQRDYIHVVDLAKAHVKSLDFMKSMKEDVQIFNIGTGKPTSVLEVVETFERVNNIKVPHKIGPRRPGDIASSYASPKKAKDILGWKAKLTLEDALKDAWRWQQNI